MCLTIPAFVGDSLHLPWILSKRHLIISESNLVIDFKDLIIRSGITNHHYYIMFFNVSSQLAGIESARRNLLWQHSASLQRLDEEMAQTQDRERDVREDLEQVT